MRESYCKIDNFANLKKVLKSKFLKNTSPDEVVYSI